MMQSLRKQPGFSLAPSDPKAQTSLGGLLCLPGHLGPLQPSTPHPPMALSPEPWLWSSTLKPRMCPQRPALGHDQQSSPPLLPLTHPKSGSQP